MNQINTILAFDLHSVVFTPNWKEIIRILWRWPHKLHMIVCAFNIRFVWKCFALLFKNPTDEEYFALFQKYCPKLLPLIIDLFNSFKPIDGMVSLLKALKAKGYELHIMSNIGPRRFTYLQQRYPHIIGLFNKAKINNGDIHHLIKKPSLDYFNSYLQDYNPEGKQVLFIDDNKQNIKAANCLGIQTILFTSLHKLRHTLTQLNIL